MAARGKAGGLIQCLVSSRLTRPVQVRANSKIYAFRVALGTLLASCVRSDARRRQSRSFLSNGSDFDIAHRLESSMRSFARYRAYCRWPTPHTKTKRRPCEDPKACDVLEYPRKEKAPRRGGNLPKALCSPFWRLGDGGDTTCQHSRDVRQPCAALSGAGCSFVESTRRGL
jgi:hypothetical protein